MFAWFENRINPFPPERPVQPPATLFAFCWHYTRDIWPWLAVTSVLTALISILQVLIFSFLGNIVDWLTGANPETFLADEGWSLFWMAAIIVVGLPLTGLFHSLIMHQTIFGNFPMVIRWKAHRYMLGQSFGFYQDEFAGRVATKVMQAALGVRESVTKIVDIFIYVGVYFGGAVILVATLQAWLMVPFLVWLGTYILLMWHYLPKMRVISERQSDARSTMTGRVVDSYTNIMTVKLFAHAGREEGYAREAMDDFLKTVHPQMRLVTTLNVSLDIANALLLFSVAAIGIWGWTAGNATVGALAVAVGLVLRLEGMSYWVMWELAGLFENIGMAEDGMHTIARPQAVTDTDSTKTLVVERGEIEFDRIRFHYGKEGGVIDDLSLTVRPGEKVGLVGRSGAGKSTLMNVLLRLYDLEGGVIRVDGQDIAQVTQDSLRSRVGVVTQDTSLLHRSVRDNIAYGNPEATDAQVIEAARRANAHDYIMDLVDLEGRTGYDAHVGERGVKLSGGQRQRIAIARVFLKNAPILVLDEATSALDSEVEAAIQDNLNALMEGKTVIAIAHRLSTIANLDRLVVLDKGAIIEEGSHDELAAAGGLYAQLWSRQSGGFIGVDAKAEAAE
ncbi:MAG: ABC transporter ATP-binding protein [Roseitalea sp.]|uniref:ABC transporter ATP-binding protein n=1 Tax=Oceaniradius stylonematis TaxID=2184161 RepID=UPI001B00C38A|nr:ABC transporter ATP-binding protein [Roseitalea sp.]MBO6952010.1 ABC transporter ATP-binding protein [Rhizobiaceae bacterium]MBO6592144.1 ABC transporter ATP-binding protein [Roseitalea sp.]MBO6598399.1 ABC transporter ATP-binding protein [Roseitalea sp.]MBO6610845.1 ABC transporter ATP-binding protein [Roseitalea sp.]